MMRKKRWSKGCRILYHGLTFFTTYVFDEEIKISFRFFISSTAFRDKQFVVIKLWEICWTRHSYAGCGLKPVRIIFLLNHFLNFYCCQKKSLNFFRRSCSAFAANKGLLAAGPLQAAQLACFFPGWAKKKTLTQQTQTHRHRKKSPGPSQLNFAHIKKNIEHSFAVLINVLVYVGCSNRFQLVWQPTDQKGRNVPTWRCTLSHNF